MSKTIGIIGCGWLGLPLAKVLLKDEYDIHGTTTSKEKLRLLEESGIHPFLISLSENGIEGAITDFLRNRDTLVINVPPKLRSGKKENYVKKMQLLYDAVNASGVEKIVFISSTSVYGDVDGEVTEETTPQPVTESGRQLLASENLFREANGLLSTIVRFGGLIGPGRHPVTMLSGKKNLSNGNAPINLIHLNDCIGIIKSILKFGWWNEVFNGVYPHHPTKREYYTLESLKRNLQIPDYQVDNSHKGKIVRANQLINVKKYQFTTTL